MLVLNTANEFLIEYAVRTPFVSFPVKLFLVGHAAELYLKVALATLDKAADVRRFGHDIARLIAACNAKSNGALADYVLRQAVLDCDFSGSWNDSHPIFTAIGSEDREHYFNHQELYHVAKALVDVRYWGGFMRTTKLWNSAMVWPNPYWPGFFRGLRALFGSPVPGAIVHAVESGRLAPESEHFLRQLL